jgi:AhpD family alkylhydroperoxidase
MPEVSPERAKYTKISPDAYRSFSSLEEYLGACGLETRLLDLVRLRASMINGCSFCVQMHSHDALRGGEREERLFQLNTWTESPVFTSRERAALAWTDALTLISSTHAPDEVYSVARGEFSEKELVDLTWAIVAINGWNRMAIGFRTPPSIPKK